MQNTTLEVDGTNWLVREAVSKEDALNAIAHARVSGSVGSKFTEVRDGNETILADVVRLNPDGTECQPYGGSVAKYAFWPYDLYPFVRGALVDGAVSYGTDGKPVVKTKAYGQHQFKPLAIIEGPAGAAYIEQLRKLEDDYREARNKLAGEFSDKALAAAPFLSDFPAYS